MTANGPVKFLFEVSNNMVTAMTERRNVQSCLLLKKVTSMNNLEKKLRYRYDQFIYLFDICCC